MGRRHGQHFLKDARAIRTILDRFGAAPGDLVVEIGPGKGAITRPLAGRVAALAAVEVDAELATFLARSLPAQLIEPPRVGGRLGAVSLERSGETAGRPQGAERGRLFVVRADALEVSYADLGALLGAGAGRKLRVIGNLPYGVATALVRRMITEGRLL